MDRRVVRLVGRLPDDIPRAAPGRLFSPLFCFPRPWSSPPLTCRPRVGPGTKNSCGVPRKTGLQQQRLVKPRSRKE